MTECIKTMGMTRPVAICPQGAFHPDYQVTGQPHVAIIDASDVLRHHNRHPGAPLQQMTKSCRRSAR